MEEKVGKTRELAHLDCRRERRTQYHQDHQAHRDRRDLALRDLRGLGRQDRRDQGRQDRRDQGHPDLRDRVRLARRVHQCQDQGLRGRLGPRDLLDRRDRVLQDRRDRRDQLLSARDAVGRRRCARVAPDAEILRGTAPAALDADDPQDSVSAKPRSSSGVLGRMLSGLQLGTQRG